MAGVATLILASIGGLQLIVFGLQARRLRETVQEMEAVGARQSAEFRQAMTLNERSVEAAQKSAAAAQGGVAEMRAARRAWISIGDVGLHAPTKLDDEGFTFSVTASIRNHGETPATGVWVYFSAYLERSDDVSGHETAKEDLRRMLRNHLPAMGIVLFREEEYIKEQRLDGSSSDVKAAVRLNAGVREVAFTIFVGVSYRVVGDSEAHFTLYPFMSKVIVGASYGNGFPSALQRDPFLAGEVN